MTTRPETCESAVSRCLGVSKLTLWVSRKPQRKYVGRGSGVIRLPLVGEVSLRVRLLVEAEDLHGG